MKFLVSSLLLVSLLKKTQGATQSKKLTVSERHIRSEPLQQWEPRIVGGQTASAQEYPWFVQGYGCGASLIWKDIVLTAAHCKGYIGDQDEEVLVGAYRKNSLVSA